MRTTIKHLALDLAVLTGAALAGGLPAAHADVSYGPAYTRNSPCSTGPSSPCIQIEDGDSSPGRVV